MLAPIQNSLTALMAALLTIVPIVGGIGLTIQGFVLILGNHARAKEGIVCAVLGIAIALGAQTMAAAIHP